jgi:hypothetical protein
MKPAALLIAPPVYDFAFYDLFVRPYGLLRIGHWLEEGGYKVNLINSLDPRDSETMERQTGVSGWTPPGRTGHGTGKTFRRRLESPEALKSTPRAWTRYGIPEEILGRKIAAEQPDVILVSSTMTYWYPGVREIVRLCRKHHPGIPVVVGGIYATLMTDHCRDICEPDVVVAGPALTGLKVNLDSFGLPVPGGEITEECLIRPVGYLDGGVLRLNEGCPFACRYCASRLIDPRFVPGDPDRQFSFIKKLHDATGLANYAFYDDALLVNKEQVLFPFLRRIIDSGMKLSFYTPNAIHIRHLDEETIDLMLAAGFAEFRMGYESADDAFHERMDGKITAADFSRVMAILKTRGMTGDRAAVYVLAGLPGQYRSEVEESLTRAREAGAFTRMAHYSPVPGTALWAESCRASRYPLDKEPLFHNNSVFPLEWEGLTRGDILDLKKLTGSSAAT